MPPKTKSKGKNAKATGKMPPKLKGKAKATLLVEPIREFAIPSHSWKVNAILPPKEQRIDYDPPKHVTYMGRPLLRIAAKKKEEFQGYIYVPLKYEKLWRHLIYGAIYWAKAYEWCDRILFKMVGTCGEIAVRATENLRDNAGVKHVQYMICRRKILEELMKVRWDGMGDIFLPTFMEFGIRHFRDWLHDDYAHAQQAGPEYLGMDPTVPANEAQFSA
jgi:hypothetical protein